MLIVMVDDNNIKITLALPFREGTRSELRACHALD